MTQPIEPSKEQSKSALTQEAPGGSGADDEPRPATPELPPNVRTLINARAQRRVIE